MVCQGGEEDITEAGCYEGSCVDGEENGQGRTQDVGEGGDGGPSDAGGNEEDTGMFGGCGVAQQPPDEEEKKSAFSGDACGDMGCECGGGLRLIRSKKGCLTQMKRHTGSCPNQPFHCTTPTKTKGTSSGLKGGRTTKRTSSPFSTAWTVPTSRPAGSRPSRPDVSTDSPSCGCFVR